MIGTAMMMPWSKSTAERRSQRKSRQRARQEKHSNKGRMASQASKEEDVNTMMDSMVALYDSELRWARSLSKAMRRSDLTMRGVAYAADATEEELAHLLAQACLPQITRTTSWYAKEALEHVTDNHNKKLIRKRRPNEKEEDDPQRQQQQQQQQHPPELLDKVEIQARKALRKVVQRASLLTGLGPAKNLGGVAASWSFSRVASMGTRTAHALGRWAGGRTLRSDHVLLICAGSALISKRGVGGFLSTLVVVRVLRSALIDPSSSDDEEEGSGAARQKEGSLG
uniref:Uncharacterized protein n=1 Tax=Octactis speculum TaxID=3111310 RepID=A0A7S2BNA3_9STRA|mmetsp:Transcript_25181/g.34535  ORF Transcript_25181/g.34535 Transcript_25181/m.34535 type:complete len:283 (+) Transcript_25181:2-850(+)